MTTNCGTVSRLNVTDALVGSTQYFWVVPCKNRGVHNKYNLFSKHAIPLAEADEVSSTPQVKAFTVRCDDCGEEYAYEANDVLRAELFDVGAFTTHPLFDKSASSDETTKQTASASSPTKTTVLERIRTAVETYLRLRHKESPLPYWRR